VVLERVIPDLADPTPKSACRGNNKDIPEGAKRAGGNPAHFAFQASVGLDSGVACE
jgi:hypothetical protein